MLQVFRMIETIGSTDATVLLLGETGTGKEGVARAIHQASRRSSGPFVPVNCAAISKELAESLLFGHKRGSFTGAKTDHRGYFAQAHGGTILLDEIGEMPIELQAKLLRVLDDKAVRPVGSEREEPVDVRVIAATNRALAEALDGGGFRRDLYYRLCLARIDIPPLRDRGTDILLLSSHFLDAYARRYGRPCPRLTGDAADTLLRYDWPGNVRELEHLAANLILTCEQDAIDEGGLPAEFRGHALPQEYLQLTLTLPPDLTLEEATRVVRLAQAQRALANAGGNHRKAAAKLGVATRTLRRVLSDDERKR
jgi:two-component system NtrC family response regulator